MLSMIVKMVAVVMIGHGYGAAGGDDGGGGSDDDGGGA